MGPWNGNIPGADLGCNFGLVRHKEKGGEDVNIVVCMKQIPDLQQIRIKDRKPLLEGAPLIFGDMDKNALDSVDLSGLGELPESLLSPRGINAYLARKF